MTLTPYRETLALRGMRSLLSVATLARIPVTAGPVVLTLHVVQDLGRGYGAAGLVGAAFTVGSSLGAPVLGRSMDRRGLRPILVLTTVAEVAFWATAQAVPYWAMLLAALVGGFLTLPVFAVARQSIAALTPESHRLPAFALDSITTELSFMAGPALGVFVCTTAGARAGMLAVGAGILVSGLGLYLLNPATRSADEAPVSAGERVPRRSWLGPRLVAVLAVTAGATLVLSGTDVAVVAALRSTGELEWTGAVLGLWAAYSLLGGFAYGTVRRGVPPLALFGPMALFTIPVGLGGGHWWLLALMLIPAGALCAPTITATADVVSRLAPAAARGEAMGLHNSSLTVGVALGAPLAGVVMDTLSPPWGFAAVGIVGVLVALLALPTQLRHRSPSTPARASDVPATSASAEEPATPFDPAAADNPASVNAAGGSRT
ncbi:MFS transporter [Krasilnikovia sp. MM14-A1004]|uniref:MFS transporter n=1 Tax=Krasilnikovia sp. MM14-A1004 TaxID=3373541 RepID=UPI00399CE700